jgi:predicted PurR-regulated permease PerM
MTTFVIILIILVLILGYVSYNLFKKVEQLERIVDSQESYISKFSNSVDFASKRLGEIDEKGTFQSDDEIGWFFESVKTLQSELDDFNLNGVRR